MKANLLLAAVVCGLCGVCTLADVFDLSWFTIDGGGQMWSTGGGWEVGATIGQPDAQAPPVMSGGGWEITGGFWAGADSGAPPIRPGDLNCDGGVNFTDINPFVQILSDFAGWQASHPGCPWQNGDCNQDGVVNFQDINPFVALLTGGG